MGWPSEERQALTAEQLKTLARDCAVAAVDAIRGYTYEFAPDPHWHSAQYEIAEMAIRSELQRLVMEK